MKISDIINYPVKSLAGNHLSSSEVHERGLKDDRRLMLIDENNTFISQRKFPMLSQIEVGITEDTLVLKDRRDNQLIKFPFQLELKKTEVEVWKSKVTSHLFLKNDVNEWLSDHIGESIRLVYMDESDHRHINPDYASKDELVSFADGYPILIANTASLKDLNSKLPSPISMDHFRPNIVIDYDIAWDEDNWKRLIIGDVQLRIAKPCARCTVINVDPKTGEKNKDILISLSKSRLKDGEILFAMNAIVEKTGVINVGDEVVVV